MYCTFPYREYPAIRIVSEHHARASLSPSSFLAGPSHPPSNHLVRYHSRTGSYNMIANTGRAIVRRLASREPILSPDRVVQLSYKPLRVVNTSHTVSAFSSGLGRFANGVIISIARRSYATKPASRPKAHTGRTTSNPRKKATTTTKSVATKKPSAVKAKPKPKPKATAKPKTKPKPKAKPKAKPPPNRRLKKALTDKQATKAALQKERARTLELKTIALTTPKLLPASAYLVLSSEITKAGHGILGKETSAKYKELTAEQLEVNWYTPHTVRHCSLFSPIALQSCGKSKQSGQ